jgi:hypothetical protein
VPGRSPRPDHGQAMHACHGCHATLRTNSGGSARSQPINLHPLLVQRIRAGLPFGSLAGTVPRVRRGRTSQTIIWQPTTPRIQSNTTGQPQRRLRRKTWKFLGFCPFHALLGLCVWLSSNLASNLASLALLSSPPLALASFVSSPFRLPFFVFHLPFCFLLLFFIATFISEFNASRFSAFLFFFF